jgi:hypothetical protein
MDRTRLRAMLSSGSSITFDVRTRETKDGGEKKSFFDYPPLRRALLLKVTDQSERGTTNRGLKTLIYLPYEANNIGNGGASLSYTRDLSGETLARFFNVDKIDDKVVRGDLEKLKVCANVPSFAPFLLRDAYERAGIAVEKSFFSITDAEVEAVKDSLRERLRPLAEMAQGGKAAMIDRERIDTLVRQMWQLDDKDVILPLSRALQIDDADAVGVLYSWIGVSFFQTEFKARQDRIRTLINWLMKESDPIEFVDDRTLKSYVTDRQHARAGLRNALTTVTHTFEQYDQSYQAMVAEKPNPLPFVKFMKTVHRDFMSLGAQLSLIEQCYSVLDFCILRPKRERVAFDILKQVMSSMQEIAGEVGQAVKVA